MPQGSAGSPLAIAGGSAAGGGFTPGLFDTTMVDPPLRVGNNATLDIGGAVRGRPGSGGWLIQVGGLRCRTLAEMNAS